MTRREWCSVLAGLVSPGYTVDTAAAFLAMLPALKHLPDTLFTLKTVAHVAERATATEGERRQSVPPFSEISRALGDYRRTYVPDPHLRQLPPPVKPDRPPATAAEVAAVAAKLRANETYLMQQAAIREGPRVTEAKLPDVTLKGEHLAAIRRARGVIPLAQMPSRSNQAANAGGSQVSERQRAGAFEETEP